MKQNFDFTMVCAGQRAFINSWLTHGNAFTMAEILLSLTIIGVVAAITLPSLTGNINERMWNTQRKALYARMSQAISLMPSLNGYGSYIYDETTSSITKDTATETFITAGLSKVLKINNICDSEHLEDCGIPNSIITLNGNKIESFPKNLRELNSMFTDTYYYGSTSTPYTNPQKDINTGAAAFETANGESIATYYNPQCLHQLATIKNLGIDVVDYSQIHMCANFIYDLNGTKGPNTVGKDIGFITALYAFDPVVVAPMPLNKDAGAEEQNNAGALCQQQGTESRLPNHDELSAMFYNKTLLDIPTGCFWSGTVYAVNSAGSLCFHTGTRSQTAKTTRHRVRCVKR